MKKNTRFAFNAYLQQLARLNGVAVEELSSKFTVEPSVQQTLEDQIQQSAAFLTLINVTPVTEQSGQLLGLGVGSTIAGTTDTTAKEREPVDPTLMVDVEYKCEQTNFDTVLTYAKLDLWAKFQDFQVRIRNAIVKRQALDRIMIGFNGVKRAKTSNRSENPLLQDVNKGWLQKIREDAPDHVMGSTTTGGETTPGAVKVGKGGEYGSSNSNQQRVVLAGWRTTGTAATRACFIGQRRRFTYCAVVVFAPHGITDGKCPENCSRCAGCTFAVWIIRFTCCCCDVYESSGGTARWTGRRRHGAASTGIWSTGDAARCPVCHIWSVRCSAQSDRSCGYCTGGRGAGCLEILATHHRISRWRGGRIQSGGRSHQCSVRTA